MSNKEIELNNVKINLTDEQIKEIVEKYGKEDDKPEIGEWYWYIDAVYNVRSFIYDGYEFADVLFSTGNWYKTKEEAEKVAELKKKYDTALANIKRNIKESFVPDWSDGRNKKYCIRYNYALHVLDYYCNTIINDIPYTIPYFATKEDAQKSIEQNADDWKIVLGVKKYE